jgi:hexosaminidase
MKVSLTIMFGMYTICAAAQQTAGLDLLPMPAQIQARTGKFRINSNFTLSVKGPATDTIMYDAVNRGYQTLNRCTGLLFNRQYITPNDTMTRTSVKIVVSTKATFDLGLDESYRLDVDTDHVTLTAPNTIGALHGLQTLTQLCTTDEEGCYFPGVLITDAPRFPWRGLMIDVARHFISLNEIRRNIDAMAAVKMNVLHWHLTDDEGFRVESNLFPLLHLKGSNGDFYSQAELRDIVKYAAARGVMIVPEFDMPGHSQSWFAGYPQLASQPGPYRPGSRTQWQNEHPDPNRPQGSSIADIVANLEAPTFDPTNDSVYAFLDRFIGEMAAIFPSAYMHIGADENNGLAWKLNPRIATWMKAHQMQSADDLQRYFVSRVHGILTKHHRQMIGWEEIYNGNLPKDAIVHKWIPENMGIVKSFGRPEEFASHGYRTLISEGFYLDTYMPAYIYYENAAFPTGNTPGVLGGEAAQWTEMADNDNISGRIWPRAGAIAERLWSPASVKDIDDMYRRLIALSYQLDQQGLPHLGNYERALRRLANKEEVGPLKTLTDVLTPVKGYRKMIANLMKGPSASFQTTPLTSVSDIIFVDSETKRKFRMLVKTWLGTHDTSAENKLKAWLISWRDNDARLHDIFPGNIRLLAVQDQSKNLSLAAAIGLEALERHDKANPSDTLWDQQQVEALRAFTKPHGETEIAIIPEISALVSGTLPPEPASYPVF